MEVNQFHIPGLLELKPRILSDDRGLFFESFRQDVLQAQGANAVFVQDNQSFSRKHVLRGIHFQRQPYEQGKLVRVIMGKALDVAVDLRPGSDTFGQHLALVLDSEKNNMLYIPEGFGHGFLALDDCILHYKCTAYYQATHDEGIK